MSKLKEEARVLSDVFGQNHPFLRIVNSDVDDFSLKFSPPDGDGAKQHEIKASFMVFSDSELRNYITCNS